MKTKTNFIKRTLLLILITFSCMNNNDNKIEISDELLNIDFSNTKHYTFFNKSIENVYISNSKVKFNLNVEFYNVLIREMNNKYGKPILFLDKDFINKENSTTMEWSSGQIKQDKYNVDLLDNYFFIIWEKDQNFIKIHKPMSFPQFNKKINLEISSKID